MFGADASGAQIDTLVISSRDGLPPAARWLGLWLYLNEISLVVDGVCLSVCAEYVFPAAATKLIRDDSIVAWRLGSLGAWHRAVRAGFTRDQYIGQTVDSLVAAEEPQAGVARSEAERALRRQELIQLTVEELESAEDFFAAIQVSPDISSWVALATADPSDPDGEAVDWTLRIADLSRFGITNVSTEGGTEYPAAAVLELESVLLVELPDDVTPMLLGRPSEREYELLRASFSRGDVSVDGTTASYVGYLSRRSVERLLLEVADAEPPVDTLMISSGGGETRLGRQLGSWVHDNRITVVVDHICFSSCANYIFTAAPLKVIDAGALVGWHGSEQQGRYISLDGECLEPDGSGAGDADASAALGVTVVRPAPREEVEYLAQIGVSADALLYGHMPERCEHYVGAGVQGWTFSITDMAAFGITNVSYEGNGQYPDPNLRAARVMLYDLDGAPAVVIGVP